MGKAACEHSGGRRRNAGWWLLGTIACLLGGGQGLGSEPLSSPLVEPDPVVRSAFLMGTEVTIEVWAGSRSEGLALSERVLALLAQSEAALSTWRDDSELGRLNRRPPPSVERLSTFVCRTWSEVLRWSTATEGAFDPAVGRLVEVWGLREGGRLAGPAELLAARRASGLDHFRFLPERCELQRLGEAVLDAGAFGKGAALQRLLEDPGLSGTASWRVNLGGQVAVYGPGPDKTGWSVDLASPVERDTAVATLRLSEGSLAVSGSFVRDSWVEGRRIGHLLDPRSGRPAAFTGAVAVWHDSALAADCLSTALFVLGPQVGLEWARRQRVAACFQIPSEGGEAGTMKTTPEFDRLLR